MGAGAAAAVDIASLTTPGSNTLLPVLQQHAHVWQQSRDLHLTHTVV
jgi:hypothetical protein